MGGSVGRDRRSVAGADGRARARGRGRLPRQPQRPQPGGDALQPHPAAAPRHEAPVQRVDGGSDAPAGGGRVRVRHPGDGAGARPRPDGVPGGARREPLRLQRQPVHRAGLSGPDRSDARSGWVPRGGGPASVANGGGGGSVAADPAGDGRPVPGRAGHDDGAGRQRRRRWCRPPCARPGRGGAGAGAVHAGGRGRGHGCCSRAHTAGGQRAGRGRQGEGWQRVWAHRLHDHRVRHAQLVADRCRQHRLGQPGPAGRGNAAHPGGRRRVHQGQAGNGPWLLDRAWADRGAGPAGGDGGVPGCRPGRRDHRRRRRPHPGVDHGGRQPGVEHSEQRAAGCGTGEARLHGQCRHVPQRDHPPRRRHPAAALAVAAQPLRRVAAPVRRAQRRQLQRAGAATR